MRSNKAGNSEISLQNKVFAMDVSKLSDKKEFDKYYALQREKRREQIDRMRFDNGKRLSLGAGAVVEKALSYAGCADEEIRITKKGKPYVDGCFFNLSHTGEVAVCAVSGVEVGIDIEKPRKFDDALVKKAFTKNEIERVKDSDCAPELVYTKLWTVKESVMKWLGEGLSLMPEFIEVDISDTIKVKIINDDEKNELIKDLKFTSYEYGEYCITVCSSAEHFCEKIAWI